MVAISSVQICNMALSHVGKPGIESLTEASAGARACKQWYDISRAQALEDHNWNFARKRLVLALIQTDPYDDWGFQYEYPADCIKARLIVNPAGPDADPIPFDVGVTDDGEEKAILTNLDSASLIYTFDLKNPSMFSMGFVHLHSWRIAQNIEYTLTGKKTIDDRKIKEIIALNTGSNAGEGMDKAPRDAEWVRGRV